MRRSTRAARPGKAHTAVTIEHGGRLASADADFRRFAALDSFNPIA